MIKKFDFTILKTSWTKYDIVQVLEVVDSVDKIEAYKKQDIVINEPILKTFLNISSLKSNTPDYWFKIQQYPREKKLFALLSVIFTHHEVISLFAKSSNENMGGIFKVEANHKMYTNIRSALVLSGASLPNYRRTTDVPYDFSLLFENGEIGVIAKQLLIDRLNYQSKVINNNQDFYDVAYENDFEKVLGLDKKQFKQWLEGSSLSTNTQSKYIGLLEIENFHSIVEANLDFESAKEVYLLGENGDGKSLILMAIYLAFRGDFITNETDLKETGEVVDMIRFSKGLNLKGVDNAGKEYGIGKTLSLNNLFAYGTHRGRYAKNSDPEKYGFMSLFSIDQTLVNPTIWLRNQKSIEIEKLLDKNTMYPQKKQYPLNFATKLLQELIFDVLEKNVEVEIDFNEVKFKEKGRHITFDQLSEGYRSILIFVIDLLWRLTLNVKDEHVELKEIIGVALIDEIDQHLHPKWQKEIVGRLRNIFPQVQFIMTTHSPTVIQGASDEAIIYRVFRDKEDGCTRISEPFYRKDLDNLMVNSLVTHPIFGLDSARLDEDNRDADTSDDYLQYRINLQIKKELDKKRKTGANFITDKEIDDLIQKLMEKELGNDKDK